MDSFKLYITDTDYFVAIKNAICKAHEQDLKIIKIGIPVGVQKEMIEKMGGSLRYKRLIDIFGEKVVQAKTLQITTEFSRFTVRRTHG